MNSLSVFATCLAKRRQTFISLVTFISIAGVAVGVMALIVVLAVMNGFQNELRDRILGITSHMVVTSFRGTIDNYPDLMATHRKRAGGAGGHSLHLHSGDVELRKTALRGRWCGVWTPNSAGQVVQHCQEPQRRQLWRICVPPAQDGPPPQPGIILGLELANNLGVHLHDWVNVISPAGRLTPLGPCP